MNNKIVIVNKESGMTSRDVVNRLNNIFQTKKIGHTGTLDPLATGVLVCLVGKYTKLNDLITSQDKEYIAEIKLGIKTDTLDITGRILKKNKVRNLQEEEIKEVLNSLIGEYNEEVPIYSAIHVKGKKLYEYARNNIEVELPKKLVHIKEMEFLSYNKDIIKFRTLVSKGTYIRSLIQTICEKLNVAGTMNSLIRTKQGKFNIEEASLLEDIENNNYQTYKIEDVLDVKVGDIKETDDLFKKIINGNKLNMGYDNGYVLFKINGEELSLYKFNENEGKVILKLS